VTTAADGTVAGSAAGDPLGALIGKVIVDDWAITMQAGDNPGKPTTAQGNVDLSGLQDVQSYQEYSFDYR
jgi:hypothetical protein